MHRMDGDQVRYGAQSHPGIQSRGGPTGVTQHKERRQRPRRHRVSAMRCCLYRLNRGRFRLSPDVRQARDVMPLKAPMLHRQRQTRNRRLTNMEEIIPAAAHKGHHTLRQRRCKEWVNGDRTG